MTTYIIAKCVSCGRKREYGPGDVGIGEHPLCPDCGSPMVPHEAMQIDIGLDRSDEWKGTDTYELTITNKKTGKVELNYDNINGGLFIIHRNNSAEPLGSDQAAFGNVGGVLICAAKAPAVLRDILERLDVRGRVKELIEKLGLPTSIV